MNEDLEKKLKEKEEASKKKLLAKLQRDRNPEIKELMHKEELQQETNEDFNNKFREEKEKLDQLLDEVTQLKDNDKLTKERVDFLTKEIVEQDAQLKDTNDTIAKKQADVNANLKLVETARVLNLLEDEKNRKFAKANAALKAKLEFIESKYDYTSSAK